MDQNSVIVGYSVLYGPVTSGVRGTVATSGRAVTVTGLDPYTNYSLRCQQSTVMEPWVLIPLLSLW